jgi:hypothetical protein
MKLINMYKARTGGIESIVLIKLYFKYMEKAKVNGNPYLATEYGKVELTMFNEVY